MILLTSPWACEIQVTRRWAVRLTLPGFVDPEEIVVVKPYTSILVVLDPLDDVGVVVCVDEGTLAVLGSGAADAWVRCTESPLYAATNRCSGWAPDWRNHERPVRVALDPWCGNPTSPYSLLTTPGSS
jgi:hypothetical protein